MIYNLEAMEEMDVCKLSMSCVNSYVFYHDSRYYQGVVQEMLKLTGGRWEKAVKWWVSNSARAVEHKAKGFIVSLRQDPYTNSKQGIGFRGVKGLLEFLEEKAFIHIYKGYVAEWKEEGVKRIPEKTVPSYLVLRERSLRLWDGVKHPKNLWKELDEQEIVQVRDRKTKDELPTRGRKGVKEERVRMQSINDFLSKSEITFDGEPIADVMYKRVFSGDMTFGGRLYAIGGGVQTLPQDIRRSALRIDGETVVELDYSAIHPNICYQMMYNKEGFSVYDVMGDDFSPYAADLSFINVDQSLREEWEKLTGENHDPIRNLAKLAILISMNSESKESAVAGLSNKIRNDRKKPIEDQLFYAINESIPCRKVCEAVQEHNDFIREHFFSDAGIVLQKIDSDIMLDIVGSMIQKGHTVLCYHDSAIVKESAGQDLHDAMWNAWKNVLGDTKFCKVERK